MSRGILREIVIGFSAGFMLMAASSNVNAIDRNNRYFAYGLGERSCEDYLKFRDRKLDALEQQHPRFSKDELYDIVNRIVEQWIAGFLTAHNLYVSDTYNVAGKSTMDDIEARLETACRANTKEHFAEAMISVVEQLNSQRVRAESPK
jgi:hypothetical protein